MTISINRLSSLLTKNKSWLACLAILLAPPVVLGDTPQVQFTDVTEAAGIKFRHINGAQGEYHLPETMGAGGAFFDYDNDGDLDLYLINSGYLTDAVSQAAVTSMLYRNNGDGTFTDTTDQAGVGNAGNYGMGAACADYDNDGDIDLYVTNFGANILYQNNGDGTFTDITEKAGVGDELLGSSATFFDYDRDGYLDLYVVNYVHYDVDVPRRPCGVKGIRTYCHPEHFVGAPDQLYRNNGDGTFTNVTEAAGLTNISGPHGGKGLGVIAADFSNDGEPDLYVANDTTPNFLFYNNGNGTFTEIGLFSGCAYSFDGIAQASMGVDAGDFNRDGFLDIFVINFSQETNALYQNNGDGTFTDVIYDVNLGKESYIFLGFGTGFFDYDNDGWLDLYIANGHISDNIEQITNVVTYAQRDQLFRNNRNGTYTEVSLSSGGYFQYEGVGRAAIFGDYDNDGDLDIAVTQSNGPAHLLRNDGGNRQNWLRIKLIGTKSNRDGFGTRVWITVGDESWMQEAHAGYSYLCSNDPRVFFGLGEVATVDRLEIHWISGTVQVLENIPANQEIVITEPHSEK